MSQDNNISVQDIISALKKTSLSSEAHQGFLQSIEASEIHRDFDIFAKAVVPTHSAGLVDDEDNDPSIQCDGFTIGPIFESSFPSSMRVCIVLFTAPDDDNANPTLTIPYKPARGQGLRVAKINTASVHLMRYGGAVRTCDPFEAEDCSWSCVYSYAMVYDSDSGAVALINENDGVATINATVLGCEVEGLETSKLNARAKQSLFGKLGPSPKEIAQSVLAKLIGALSFESETTTTTDQIAGSFEPGVLSKAQKRRLRDANERLNVFHSNLTELDLGAIDTHQVFETVRRNVKNGNMVPF